MKCVCPMGGDRTCPDDCPLAVWANLSTSDRKTQRKSIAENLYKQGFTQEQIATQLGVSQRTISEDLRDLEEPSKSKPAKTASNPKGAGRPKGSKPRSSRKPGQTQRQHSINAKPEDWDRFKQKAEAEGKTAAQKLGEMVVEPEIDPRSLSLSAQEKLETAKRQQERRLDATFHDKVNARANAWLRDTILPQHRQEQAIAKKIVNARRGVMDKQIFNKIRRALHPDSRLSISEKLLAEAFDAFMALEKLLLNERDSPTTFGAIPSTIAEWDAMRAKASAQRRTQRNSGTVPARAANGR